MANSKRGRHREPGNNSTAVKESRIPDKPHPGESWPEDPPGEPADSTKPSDESEPEDPIVSAQLDPDHYKAIIGLCKIAWGHGFNDEMAMKSCGMPAEKLGMYAMILKEIAIKQLQKSG